MAADHWATGFHLKPLRLSRAREPKRAEFPPPPPFSDQMSKSLRLGPLVPNAQKQERVQTSTFEKYYVSGR